MIRSSRAPQPRPRPDVAAGTRAYPAPIAERADQAAYRRPGRSFDEDCARRLTGGRSPAGERCRRCRAAAMKLG